MRVYIIKQTDVTIIYQMSCSGLRTLSLSNQMVQTVRWGRSIRNVRSTVPPYRGTQPNLRNLTWELKTDLDPLSVVTKWDVFSLSLSPDNDREFSFCSRRSSEIMFGLTPMEVWKAAYECAVTLNIKVPKIWTENKCVAGPDCLSGPVGQAVSSYSLCKVHLLQQRKHETVLW